MIFTKSGVFYRQNERISIKAFTENLFLSNLNIALKQCFQKILLGHFFD
jgi:hypothetical protein